MSYKEYTQLPWEYDVSIRQKKLIEQIIGWQPLTIVV
jgi:hypothetical protein